ncbi:apyrase family protein [Cryptosporidium muris RN66]|uniref:Apyrase family protein n=1 Tax=Cryptosporidium muris (strain RN66) TaxID=441375 RepID=B6ADQ4_CRYMR|nr:apyrase family protein [Cryptosporidium muris RN66]EEA06345.1 apyrase family protein [Cryptosporidium muris RN66]|eukprot:XP_002140694.1 apyrase family protein [Cryptosporidium muris RN66]
MVNVMIIKKLIFYKTTLLILFFNPSYFGSEVLASNTQFFCNKVNPCSFKLVADLDLKSRPSNPGEKDFRSILQKGRIYFDTKEEQYKVTWDAALVLLSGHNEYGRGMELSELVIYDGKLLAGDDRSGIMFEIIDDGKVIAPRYILSEGDGNKGKGMKIEWATVRDDVLWVGSFGKEFVQNGIISKQDNMWVASVDKFGNIRYYNWSKVYNSIRSALDADFPGYCIHEAVGWSPYMRKWIFLPRRVSNEPYDEFLDEMKGSNKMVILSDDLEILDVKAIGDIIPERGFSSFKFLPGSKDQIIVALKTVENSRIDFQSTYVSMFTIDGDLLIDDIKVPGEFKFEGIEFTSF